MKFDHLEKGLKIKFSWKEIFFIIIKKSLSFDQKGTYVFYTHFMHMINDAMVKYGDAKKHGEITKETEVDPDRV